MSICNVYSNAALNTMFAPRYLALMNGDPTQAGLLTQEMAGDGYVRKLVPFSTASARTVHNAEVVWWSDLPNTPIRYIAVVTQLTGGAVIAYKATGSDIYVAEGQRFVLGIGDLAFTMN